MVRKLVIAAIAVLGGTALAVIALRLPFAAAPIAFADTCGTTVTTCPSSPLANPIVSAVFRVDHQTTSGEPVQANPFALEDWTVFAHYATVSPTECEEGCVEHTYTTHVRVWWTGTSWQLNCANCGPVIFRTASVCVAGSCANPLTPDYPKAWAYKIVLGLDEAEVVCATQLGHAHLTRVELVRADGTPQTGRVIDAGPCVLTRTVAHPVLLDTATDAGPFECAQDCAVNGAGLTLLYY